MGHARVTVNGVRPQQEDLRDDRDLAQSADRGRAPLRLSRRHRHEAHLGRRGEECLTAGGDRGERRGLPGDIGHLRGCQGGQGGLVGVLEAPEGAGVDRRAPDHLGRLPGVGGERRRVLPRCVVAKVRGSLLPQRLQSCDAAEDARGGGDAEGDPRQRGHCRRPGKGFASGRQAARPAAHQSRRARGDGRCRDAGLLRVPGGTLATHQDQ